MKINLSNSAFIGNIDPFLKSFRPTHPEVLEITAHKKWIYVHPVVLAMVASLGLTAKEVKCERLEAASRHYLERMGLFKFLGVPSGIRIIEHEAAGRFIPLTQIRSSGQLSSFIQEVIPLLHRDPRQAEPLRQVLGELVRNVLEHAESSAGAFVSAQYYKKSNTIRVGVADRGIGIKESITHSHPAGTDLEAIRLALTPGITGTIAREGGTELNAGAGLFLIKSIAQANRNFFMLYSGRAMYKLLKQKQGELRLHADPFRNRHSAREDLPFWQGTAVGIDITLEPSTEFVELLDFIWEVYRKAVRERKKEKYRRPRFL